MNKYTAFVVYTILYEALIWGVFGYAVFVLGHSGWWFLLALLLSGSQLKARRFGISEVQGGEDE